MKRDCISLDADERQPPVDLLPGGIITERSSRNEIASAGEADVSFSHAGRAISSAGYLSADVL